MRAFDPTVPCRRRRSRELPAWPPGRPRDRLQAYPDAYAACDGAAAVVVLTEWDEFRWLDFAKVRDLLAAPSVVDARNLLDPAALRRHGLHLLGDRPAVSGPAVRWWLGGAGFLGSHLCEPWWPGATRSSASTTSPPGPADNVAHLAGHAGFALVVADVSASDPGGRAGRRRPPPGQPGLAPDYLARPLETLAVGSEGTRHGLALAEAHGARFLLASTSEVYGDPEVHPQTEAYWGNVNPVGPRSVYDEAKRFAEALTMACHRTRGTDVGIVRIFNTYGPRLRPGDGRVVSNFLVQALEGRAAHRLRRRQPRPGACATWTTRWPGSWPCSTRDVTGPVNIGNPDEHTMLELARIVLELTGSRIDDRPRAPAGRRSHPAAARHHPGPPGAGLGADRRPRRRPAPDGRLLRRGRSPGAGGGPRAEMTGGTTAGWPTERPSSG